MGSNKLRPMFADAKKEEFYVICLIVEQGNIRLIKKIIESASNADSDGCFCVSHEKIDVFFKIHKKRNNDGFIADIKNLSEKSGDIRIGVAKGVLIAELDFLGLGKLVSLPLGSPIDTASEMARGEMRAC